MADDSWRGRLASAIENSGMSLRAASIKSGHSAGYVHAVLSGGREPTVQALMDLATALNISYSWLAFGVELSPEAEKLALIYDQLTDVQKANILFLAESLSGAQPDDPDQVNKAS